MGGNAEEGGEEFPLLIVGLAVVGRERGKDGLIGEDGALHEGCEDPGERMEFVGEIAGSEGPAVYGVGEITADGSVPFVEVSGGCDGLVEGAEGHGEDDAEGMVKAGEWVGAEIGVVVNCGGDPGMGELEERGSSGGEEECGFAVDAPAYGLGVEDSGEGIAGRSAEGGGEFVELGRGDRMWGNLHVNPWMAEVEYGRGAAPEVRGRFCCRAGERGRTPWQ